MTSRKKQPTNSMTEKVWKVRYTNGRCFGDCCIKVKEISAFTRQDARERFQKAFPLANVSTID